MVAPAFDCDWGNATGNFPVLIHWMSRKFPEPDHVRDAMYTAWLGLGDWRGGLRLMTGRWPRKPAVYVAHVWVGVDLAWRNVREAGFCSWDFRYKPPVGSEWACYGAFVDDLYSLTPVMIGQMIAHEVKHCFGLTHTNMLLPHDEQVAMIRAGADKAVAWAGPTPVDEVAAPADPEETPAA